MGSNFLIFDSGVGHNRMLDRMQLDQGRVALQMDDGWTRVLPQRFATRFRVGPTYTRDFLELVRCAH